MRNFMISMHKTAGKGKYYFLFIKFHDILFFSSSYFNYNIYPNCDLDLCCFDHLVSAVLLSGLLYTN